jgi:hypothetical protein
LKTTDAETAATDQDGTPVTWAGLLEAFRTGSRQQWSALLIERLGPWLSAARRQLYAAPPYLDQEDVAQQLILEVLKIASRWQPVCEDRWIPRRLVERAARKLLKSLLAERLDQTVELDVDLEAPELAETELVLDTPVGKASIDDLRLIYRARVIGEPVEVLAAEAGLTPKQMRRRLKSARERARTAAAVSR